MSAPQVVGVGGVRQGLQAAIAASLVPAITRAGTPLAGLTLHTLRWHAWLEVLRLQGRRLLREALPRKRDADNRRCILSDVPTGFHAVELAGTLVRRRTVHEVIDTDLSTPVIAGAALHGASRIIVGTRANCVEAAKGHGTTIHLYKDGARSGGHEFHRRLVRHRTSASTARRLQTARDLSSTQARRRVASTTSVPATTSTFLASSGARYGPQGSVATSCLAAVSAHGETLQPGFLTVSTFTRRVTYHGWGSPPRELFTMRDKPQEPHQARLSTR